MTLFRDIFHNIGLFIGGLMARVTRISLLILFVAFFNFDPIYAIDKTKSAHSAQPLEILSITPSGEDVPVSRQITFQFNRPVVPIGRMDRDAAEIPIVITPEVKGQWRWLNVTKLALMLDGKNALAPATHYEITVKPGIKTEDNTMLTGNIKHAFITERPKVVKTEFKIWESPVMPVMRIIFNQPVSRDSLEKHLFIRVMGQEQSRIVTVAKPDAIYEKRLSRRRIGKGDTNSNDSPEERNPNHWEQEISSIKNGMEYRTVWLVSPKDELPQGHGIEFCIEPGLESPHGPEKGLENRLLHTVPAFPEFSFLGIECTDRERKYVLIKSGDEQCHCNPYGRKALVFSTPVFRKEVIDKIKVEPVEHLKENHRYSFSDVRFYNSYEFRKESVEKFKLYIPFTFEPNKNYKIRSDSNIIMDAFGRTLSHPIDIELITDLLSPNYGFRMPVVLEKYADTDMPVTVTNLDTLAFTYDRITNEGKERSLEMDIPLPNIPDSSLLIPAQVRKMLGGQSGVVYGKVTTSPYVDTGYNNPAVFIAQVTPFHVHIKNSDSGTLIWVTDMATGEPVSEAKVELYKESFYQDDGMSVDFSFQPSILAEGITDSDGIALLRSKEKNDPKTIPIGFDHKELFVRVAKGNDIAFMPGVSLFSVRDYSDRYKNCLIWGTTAQGIYRPGDKVQYKIYVRDHDDKALIPAPQKGYHLKVFGPGEKLFFEAKDLELSEYGALQGEFKLPVNCASGVYSLELASPYFKRNLYPVTLLVTDFTPAPFVVTTRTDSQYYQPDDTMKVYTDARLHGGGSFGNAEARVTVSLKRVKRPSSFFSDTTLLQDFDFSPGGYSEKVIGQKESLLDNNGNLITDINISGKTLLGELDIESAVRDDRGKYVSEKTRAKFSSRDRFVGIKYSVGYCYKEKPCSVDMLAVDITGKPVSDIPITIAVKRKEIVPPRVEAGKNPSWGRYTEKWNDIESHTMESREQAVAFSFIPKETGEYRITASIRDSKGREHESSISEHIYEKRTEPVYERENNYLEITADKTTYKVGETARYTIKNPFPGENALITIERNGIIKHWVQKLDTENPVVEVQIEKDFFPGFYFSALVVSPRTEKPLIDDNDLGKPAFRMGYVKTALDDRYKEIIVRVKPEKESYKPGDRIKVNLKVASKYEKSEKAFELAVVAINNEVFSLLSEGKKHFDPFDHFYSAFGLGVDNYNLLKALTGRLPFGDHSKDWRKFAISDSLFMSAFKLNESEQHQNSIDLRSNFKNIGYWNPSILTDSEGKASIEFEAPDNLTGWRVFAMAVTPTDQMGLGEGRFAVSRSTEIRPVMPNQVTEGDSFRAGFSIMNRTDKTRELSMSISAEGAIETEGNQDSVRIIKTVSAEPYKRTIVWLPLKTKGSGKINFKVRGGDASDQDGLVHELEVRKMVNLETVATYGTSSAEMIKESLQFPHDIRTNVGKVKVTLSPSVIGQVEGAFTYLRDYPYGCWEQSLTKAVMASYYQSLKNYVPEEFTWEGSADLTQTMLDRAASYQAPDGGMAYYTPRNEYADSYLSAYTALVFTWLEDRGYYIPSDVREKLNGYLLSMLETDEIPDFYSEGMISTVRAVALAALANQGKMGIEDLKRYYSKIKEMDLFGKAHFLMAAIGVKGTEVVRKEIFDMILAHADRTGGKFVCNEMVDTSYSRILASPLRTNAAVLSSLIAYGKTKEGKKMVGDIPFKIVRYITQTRKQSGRWENTQENIFCMKALIEYSETYENEEPDMAIRAKLGTERMGEAEFKDVRENPVELTTPIRSGDPGRKTEVTIERDGAGRLFYSAGIVYAPLKPDTGAVNAGIDIKREYSVERNGEWTILRNPVEIRRGELVRVDLFVSLPSARNFVVVNDPIPGGLEPVNSDLATSSIVDAGKGEYQHAKGSWWFHYGDWSNYGISKWSFYHRELRHHAARFYSEYLPAGNYHLSYTAQAIAPGEFTAMPTHAEEMYDPEVFGKSSATALIVNMKDGK